MSRAINSAKYLNRVASLLPAWRDRAVACEQARQLPDETFKEIQEAELLRAVQPRRYGGHELDLWTFYRGVMETAGACPSTGWVLGVVGVHQWQLALFPQQAQEDVWGDDASAQISSSYAPTGRVESADGGYRLSGSWSFSSGCDHCRWAFLGGVVRGTDGRPDMRTFLLPRSDYEIVDDWRVSGLCGTGSKSIQVVDAFVPEHRTHRFVDAFARQSPGQPVNPGPLYRLPFGCVFSSTIAIPAIGAARAALHLYRDQTRERLSAYDFAKVAEDPFAQVRLAHATAEIDAAHLRLEQIWSELTALAEADADIPVTLRRRCRLDSAGAVARCVDAVDRVFEASGGRAIFLDNPVQRYFRDVHAMRAHAMNNPDKAAQLFGRAELMPGAPPSGPGDLFV